MGKVDNNRKRNQTISFRMSPEERCALEARIKISGMSKAEYFIQSLLHQEINIAVGKYQSDRLSLEIRRLYEQLNRIEAENGTDSDLWEALENCKVFVGQLVKITSAQTEKERCIYDFSMTRKGNEKSL